MVVAVVVMVVVERMVDRDGCWLLIARSVIFFVSRIYE